MNRRDAMALGLAVPLVLDIGRLPEMTGHCSDFVAEFDPMWHRTRLYTVEVVNAMPEDKYGYRPVPEVRSFAEQVMHIAASNYGFADAIRGESLAEVPSFDSAGRSRDQMIAIMSESFDVVINLLLSQTPVQLEERVRWARRLGAESTHSKRGVALTMWHHLAHHRAQLVLYLRLNGIEPPSYVD